MLCKPLTTFTVLEEKKSACSLALWW